MSMHDTNNLINYLRGQSHASALAFSYQSLTQQGMSEIGKFLADSAQIRTLDIKGSVIQGWAVTELANGIRVNHSLRNLILKANSIGKDPTGVATLCDALKMNSNITHVDLRNNNINNLGARCIGDMLLHNTKITHIDLSWNNFGVDGGFQILDGLRRNTTLIDCQLSGSRCSEDTVREVATILRRNRIAAENKSCPLLGRSASTTILRRNRIAAGNKSCPSVGRSASTTHLADSTLSPTRVGGLDVLSRSLPSSAFASPHNIPSPFAAMLPAMFSPTAYTPASYIPAVYTPAASSLATCTPRSTNTKIRLMQKQQEVFSPDDHHFYGKVSDHLNNLELEVAQHKQITVNTEAREKQAMADFVEREHTLKMEIALHNDKIKLTTEEKNNLQLDVANKKTNLASAQDEHARSIRDNAAAKQQAQEEEQSLQNQLRDLNHTNHNLEHELAVNTDELNNIRGENARLRSHVVSFQTQAHNILTQC